MELLELRMEVKVPYRDVVQHEGRAWHPIMASSVPVMHRGVIPPALGSGSAPNPAFILNYFTKKADILTTMSCLRSSCPRRGDFQKLPMLHPSRGWDAAVGVSPGMEPCLQHRGSCFPSPSQHTGLQTSLLRGILLRRHFNLNQ